MELNTKVKLIAFYLPQYHTIPENDEWWGKGFTDWVNVKKARPLFQGHYQPRVPLNGFYYDLSSKEALRWQIDIAKNYGILGFCHYHYWFDGRQLLETPTNIMLQSKDLDFPFCLAWANSTWSRRWDWDENAQNVLIKQTHVPEKKKWLEHFNYLIKAWTDPRAIKIDGKPIFLIYSPHTINQVGNLLDFLRSKAVEYGLSGLYIIAMQQFKFINKNFLRYFDAIVLFQPSVAMFVPGEDDRLLSKISVERYLRSLPKWLMKPLKRFRNKFSYKLNFHDYDALWKKLLNYQSDTSLMTFPGAFIDWDNTARYGKRARIVRGANPEQFEFWFKQLVQKVASKPENERLIFINAWNEWAEGTYLEPDEKYQYQYLESVKHCLMSVPGT